MAIRILQTRMLRYCESLHFHKLANKTEVKRPPAYARYASRESDGLNNFLSVNGVYSVLEHLRSSSKSLKQTFGMKREAEVRKAGSSSSIVQKNRGANRLDHIVVLRDAYLLLLNRLSLLLHSFI